MGAQEFLRSIAAEHRAMKRQLLEVQAEYMAMQKACADVPRSITHELDSVPGRRIFYNLSGTQPFDDGDARTRLQPINFLVSQDGPFVMTHYPQVMWSPSAPDDATLFGAWRPIYSWPLPDQVVDGDIIDISYELVSGGSQRNFQNLPANPVLSNPNNLIPLPVPTMFAPNETVQFFATLNRVAFDAAAAIPTTGGLITVTLPGYRIVNM